MCYIQGKKNCYYHGKVREHPDWTVVISTCFGVRYRVCSADASWGLFLCLALYVLARLVSGQYLHKVCMDVHMPTLVHLQAQRVTDVHKHILSCLLYRCPTQASWGITYTYECLIQPHTSPPCWPLKVNVIIILCTWLRKGLQAQSICYNIMLYTSCHPRGRGSTVALINIHIWCVNPLTCRGTFGVYSLRNMTYFIEPLEETVLVLGCVWLVVRGGMWCTMHGIASSCTIVLAVSAPDATRAVLDVKLLMHVCVCVCVCRLMVSTWCTEHQSFPTLISVESVVRLCLHAFLN